MENAIVSPLPNLPLPAIGTSMSRVGIFFEKILPQQTYLKVINTTRWSS